MKAINYILICLWISILISTIGIVKASDNPTIQSLGKFELGKNIILVQSGGDFSTIYDYCNISNIKYPNSSIAVSNVRMTLVNNEFQYSYNLTTELGDYIVSGYCGYNSGGVITWSYNFTIGSDITILIFLFIGAVTFLVLSMFGNEELFIFISGVLFLVGGMYSLIYGFGSYNQLYVQAIGIVGIGVGILLIFSSYLNTIRDDEDEKSWDKDIDD